MTTEQLIIEGIARMDQDERESLVRNLVERYPDLADGLMANIGYELMDRDQKQEDYAYPYAKGGEIVKDLMEA